jgi:hypothetical protein
MLIQGWRRPSKIASICILSLLLPFLIARSASAIEPGSAVIWYLGHCG